ncbi:MAG: NrsF family protein [Hyphomonadaceae bacterium]
MKTEDLIQTLARSAGPAENTRWRLNLALTLVVGFAVAAALVAIGLGVRPDIGAARMPIMMKALFSALTAAMILPIVLQLMKPGRPLGWRIGAVALFIALCATATVVALMGEDPGKRLDMWMGNGVPWCVVLIPILAAPTAAGLLWLMRAFAPTRLALTGAAIGGFAGGVGAVAYAMYCPVDSVAFVTTWYVLGIALSAAIGAVVGAKVLRW